MEQEPEFDKESDLVTRLTARFDHMEQLSNQFRAKGRLGRFLMLRTNPQLREYIEYQDAQASVAAAHLERVNSHR